jgi:hypothetical protein
MNRATLLEAKLPVDGRIGCVARLQIASSAFTICQLGDVRDELASMALTTSSRARAKVDEVPGLKLAVAKGGGEGRIR